MDNENTSILSSDKLTEINVIKSCLHKIFYLNSNQQFTGILKSTNKIPILLHLLYISNTDHSLTFLIDLFSELFLQSPYLIDIFHQFTIEVDNKVSSIIYNMTIILLDKFYKSITPDQGKKTKPIQNKITLCLDIILSHRNSTKDSYEYVFQRLSKNLSNNKRKDEIDSIELYHSIKLLQILYGKNTLDDKLDNYFYFAGKGCLEVNIQKIRFTPSLGCTITFWFFIEYDLDLVQDIEECLKESTLIYLKNIDDEEIKVVLCKSRINILLNGHVIKEINYDKIIEPRKWYQLSFVIKPKQITKSPSIQLILRSTAESNCLSMLKVKDKDKNMNKAEEEVYIKGFNLDKPLEKLFFFDNFIGRITSLVYARRDYSQTFTMPYGIYNNYILNSCFKRNPNSIKTKTDLRSSNVNDLIKPVTCAIPQDFLSNVQMLFVPMHYEKRNSELDDIMMHFTAEFQSPEYYSKSNGVILNYRYNNNVQMVGGFSVLIPIIEIIFLIAKNNSKEESNEPNNIINNASVPDAKNILIEYFKLIAQIIRKSNANFELANSKYFFSNISLFLAKLPKYLFSDELLKIFCEISNLLPLTSFNPQLSSMNFFNCILLNEKIIFKFSYQHQIELWKSINSLLAQGFKVSKLMSISKICLILRAYDSFRYSEFCCKEHREIFLFNPKSTYGEKEIMIPDMKTKIDSLQNIILYMIKQSPLSSASIDKDKDKDINRDWERKENVLLFKLLTLDLSPCLQKFIIETFKLYFTEISIVNLKKETLLRDLLSVGFIDISLYVMSISLMDVKCELIDLLRILIGEYRKVFIEYYIQNRNRKITAYWEFIKENILPSNIVIEEESMKEIMIDSFELERDDGKDIKGDRISLESPEKIGRQKEVIEDEEIVIKAPLTSKNSKKVKLNFSFLKNDETKVENDAIDNIIEKDDIVIDKDIIGKDIDNDNKENKFGLRSAIIRHPKIPRKSKGLSLSIDYGNKDANNSNSKENTNENNDTDEFGLLDSNNTKESKELFKEFEKAILTPSPNNQIKKQNTYHNVKNPTLRRSHDFFHNLRLDTKKINQEAEENEANFQSKVFLLAKHCVDYIKGEEYLDCNSKQFEKNGSYNANPNNNTNKESDDDQKLRFRTKRTLQSIHEDELESRQSINKTPSIQDTMKRLEMKSKLESIIKQNQSQFNYDIQELPIGHKYLIEYFDKELYHQSIDQLVGLLIKWLHTSIIDTRSLLSSHNPNATITNSNEFISDLIHFQNLTVTSLIHSLIKIFSMTSKIEFILKLVTYLAEQIESVETRGRKNTITHHHKHNSGTQTKIFLPMRKVIYYLLYNDELFYQWIIDTAFQCSLILNDKEYNSSCFIKDEKRFESAVKIYDKCKSLFVLLIFEDITSNDSIIIQLPKTESKGDHPIEKINTLLTWGVYQKCIHTHFNPILLHLSNFLNEIMMLTLTVFIEELNIKKVPPSTNDKLWLNFLSFTCYCYEYLVLYNINQKILEGGKSYNDPNNEYTLIPSFLFDGISMVYNQSLQVADKLQDIWLDYNILKIIYDNYKSIWNYDPKLLNMSNYNSNANDLGGNTGLSQYSLLKKQIDKIVEELIFNKKMQSVLGLDMLFYSFKDKANTSMSIPLITIISNLISLTISILKENSFEEAQYWINQYKEFIVYCIVASLNMCPSDKRYLEYQNTFYTVILFAFNHLIEHSFLSQFPEYYRNSLVTITYLISRVLLEKKTKEDQAKGTIKAFIGIKPPDLSQSALMLLISQYENYSSIMKEKLFDIDKMASFTNDKEELEYDKIISFYQDNLKLWKRAIISLGELKVIRQSLFNSKLYEDISKKRFEDIGLMISTYEIHPEYAEDEFVKRTMLKVSPKYYISKSYNTERLRVSKAINGLIPFIKKEIKKYSRSLYTEDKQNREIYTKYKKRLFSWRGAWSNRELFFTKNKLKYKILNHYTSEFSRPLLMPILDLNDYLPTFTEYNRGNLFLDKEDNNGNYGININLRNLFQSKTDNRQSILLSPSATLKSNSFYLKSLYETSYSNNINLWENSDNKMNLDFGDEDCVQMFLDNTNEETIQLNTVSPSQLLMQQRIEYPCCIVKLTHHVKGTFTASKKKLLFSINQRQQGQGQNQEQFTNKNELFQYDNERGTCYGSVFPHSKDNDSLRLQLLYTDITFILKRKSFVQKTAIEIFTIKNKSYYFNFQSQTDRDKVVIYIKDKINGEKIYIEESKDDQIIGFRNPKYTINQMKNLNLSTIISHWSKWKMSTFEFLMWLNLYSNRSYRDISQYPVFPWSLTNFLSTNLTLPRDERNFELPIGMLELSEKGVQRKNEFITLYETMKNEELANQSMQSTDNEFAFFQRKPYFYGTHYSNAIYVSHYLLRLFPYSSIMIELQGNKFDDPDRIFSSLARTFESLSSIKSDVRELCPEFYYLPEMFHNVNQLNFGACEDKNKQMTQIMDVELPPWCNNDINKYIKLSRKHFEGISCSSSIHNWINLIFGSKQKGKKAEEAFNVFLAYSYENNIDFCSKKEKEDVLMIMRFLEMGITPTQIISYDLDQRKPKPQNTFVNSKRLRTIPLISLSKFNPVYLHNINKSMQIAVNQLNEVMELTLSNENEVFKKTTFGFEIMSNECNPALTFKINTWHFDYKRKKSIVLYNKGLYKAEGGYWDGRIIVSERSKEYSSFSSSDISGKYNMVYSENDSSPIVIIQLNKDESVAYCGNKNGSLIVYTITQLQWTLYSKKSNHSDEITSISLNEQLNVIATASYDGFVVLYTLPTLENFRVIKMTADYANEVFLSLCPLPSVVMYSNKTMKFYSYSINGSFYKEVHKNKDIEVRDNNREMIKEKEKIGIVKIDKGDLISPLITRDCFFYDHLIYGSFKGDITIRRFPSMELIKHEKIFENNSPIYSLNLSYDSKYLIALSNDKELKKIVDLD